MVQSKNWQAWFDPPTTHHWSYSVWRKSCRISTERSVSLSIYWKYTLSIQTKSSLSTLDSLKRKRSAFRRSLPTLSSRSCLGRRNVRSGNIIIRFNFYISVRIDMSKVNEADQRVISHFGIFEHLFNDNVYFDRTQNFEVCYWLFNQWLIFFYYYYYLWISIYFRPRSVITECTLAMFCGRKTRRTLPRLSIHYNFQKSTYIFADFDWVSWWGWIQYNRRGKSRWKCEWAAWRGKFIVLIVHANCSLL